MERMGKDVNRLLTEGKMQMSLKYMKRCSISLIIRYRQLKVLQVIIYLLSDWQRSESFQCNLNYQK